MFWLFWFVSGLLKVFLVFYCKNINVVYLKYKRVLKVYKKGIIYGCGDVYYIFILMKDVKNIFKIIFFFIKLVGVWYIYFIEIYY